ncbi:hypothetical protein PBCV1_A647R [Paramecium bursaria Chlorella virus 1]|uniref:Uncharacterized protein n=1 Tax=Paramecium bursaria Chlorella virus 1 TaxID=10506 RepID=O41129_PBCV1|nr:hypothetical protein PBCV1_A647R [Paramecium bursaria Chlorella virus 1]AAC96971.1 hypothetical protein [Paramecium bursaria Chlorella virus 1]
MESYRTTFYKCGCGYKTIAAGNANKHKKTSCGHEMNSESRSFIWEEDVKKVSRNTPEGYETRIKQLEKRLKLLRMKLEQYELEEINDIEIDDELSHPGLVYYIVDKDLPTRAKFGRTTNTDIRKLKTRYSIFGDPLIFCFYCDDIRNAERKLKIAMKDAGCMNNERGLESFIHSKTSMEIFHRIAIESQ